METKVKLKIVFYPKLAGKTRGGVWVKAIMQITEEQLEFKFQKHSFLKSILLVRLPIKFNNQNSPKSIKQGLFEDVKIQFEKKGYNGEITLKNFENQNAIKKLLSWPS